MTMALTNNSQAQPPTGGSNELPPVWAVVLTYNGQAFLPDSLSTLLETDYPNLHILLVDNGSAPELAKWVSERFPKVEQLRIDENIGFARASNRGMREALWRGAKYVALFDDDTAVPRHDWLKSIIVQLENDPRAGIVGFPQTTSLKEAAAGRDPVTLTPTNFAVGFALLFRDTVLEEVGMFEEMLVAFCEEDDLEQRAQDAGYKVLLANLPIYHVGGATHANYSRAAAYLQMRNGLRHRLKHNGLLSAAARAIRILEVTVNPWPLTFRANDASHRRMRGGGNCLMNAWQWLSACIWNMYHLPQTLASRARDRRQVAVAREKLTHRLAQQIITLTDQHSTNTPSNHAR